MRRRIGPLSLGALGVAILSVSASAQSNLTAKAGGPQPIPAAVAAVADNDRTRDGLVGPVRRVRTEVARLSTETGKMVESKHALLELASYDLKGNKVENQYFPITGANLTGKEVYKYDEKGNISEMNLFGADGSLLSKEIYKYEFDFAGNWNKMTTSVAVVEGGKLSFEPTEVTYRLIMYYLDENMMKMAQPGSQSGVSTPQATPASVPANSAANLNVDSKTALGGQKAPTNSSSGSGQKVAPVLPHSMVGQSDRLNLTDPVELASASSDAGSQLTVKLASEPPPPAPPPLLKPISGGVLNGTAISLPAPTYPEAARRLRASGVVSVEVVVDETGKVISAVATSGPTTLRDVAVEAALRARFSPTKLSGQPVKVSGLINYKFTLVQ